MTAFAGVIQVRKDTAANWTSNNPTLAAGELGAETDTGCLKMGDGATAWTSLAYTIGKWRTYTPTWTNITVGSSTSTGEYIEIGDLVFFTASIVSGASFAVTGTPRVSLPVTAIAAPQPSQFGVWMRDAGTANYLGAIGTGATTTATGDISCLLASGSYAQIANVSSSAPFTWTTASDTLIVSGWYVKA